MGMDTLFPKGKSTGIYLCMREREENHTVDVGGYMCVHVHLIKRINVPCPDMLLQADQPSVSVDRVHLAS